jgi:chemotaxis protein CheY-P-specific phosphatase CheC
METTYINIQAHIRQANQMRSDALGEILATGWNHLKQALSHLSHHQPQKQARFAHD